MFLVCAVCRTRLAVVEAAGRTDRYVHSVEGNLGHDPVPVPEDVLAGKALCAFCSETATVVFPVDPLRLVASTDANLGEVIPTWPACSHCAALVEGDSYPALTMRAVTAAAIDHGLDPTQRASLRGQLGPAFERFREARTGPPTNLA